MYVLQDPVLTTVIYSQLLNNNLALLVDEMDSGTDDPWIAASDPFGQKYTICWQQIVSIRLDDWGRSGPLAHTWICSCFPIIVYDGWFCWGQLLFGEYDALIGKTSTHRVWMGMSWRLVWALCIKLPWLTITSRGSINSIRYFLLGGAHSSTLSLRWNRVGTFLDIFATSRSS